MRITTANAFDVSVAQLQRRQQALTLGQEQLTSGKRVRVPSDDPAAAARAERALAAVARSDANQRALESSRHAMTLAESSLGFAGELMQQARELIIGAGNGGLSDSNRGTLAEALRGLRTDLLAVANRSDGAGRYLFGGQGSDGPPLLDTATGVVYAGTPGEQQAAAGEPAPLSVDGYAAWLSTPDPATPGAQTSVFAALDTLINGLLVPGQTSAAMAPIVSTGLAALDATAGTLSTWRARTGEALNRLDGTESRLSQSKLDAQSDRSSAEDLDLVAAISDVRSQQTGYDAALQMYSMVQRMSLFDYLR